MEEIFTNLNMNIALSEAPKLTDIN